MNQESERRSMNGEREAAKVSRDFDFPRELVFNMLTDPKKGAVSWSPEEAVNLVFELDPRPGGAIRIHDRDGEGNVAKTTGTVVEIVVPELLVVKTATTLPTGSAPWEALQTLSFEELGPRKTRVTVLVKVLASGSFPGGVESLEEGFQGGWGQVLEKLQRALR
jgi:uncharacterized protein YndB with AHSA1/START domain